MSVFEPDLEPQFLHWQLIMPSQHLCGPFHMLYEVGFVGPVGSRGMERGGREKERRGEGGKEKRREERREEKRERKGKERKGKKRKEKKKKRKRKEKEKKKKRKEKKRKGKKRKGKERKRKKRKEKTSSVELTRCGSESRILLTSSISAWEQASCKLLSIPPNKTKTKQKVKNSQKWGVQPGVTK